MSTFNFLTDIDSVKKTSIAIATLDAILMPDWERRYYSFNAHWDTDEQMASMRNGEGDEYYILFTKTGAAIKMILHENAVQLTTEPEELKKFFPNFFTEPAFRPEITTYCVWRTYQQNSWQTSLPTSAVETTTSETISPLSILSGNPDEYVKYAQEYYEKLVPKNSVEQIYNHQPLNNETIVAINPQAQPEAVYKELEELGYLH